MVANFTNYSLNVRNSYILNNSIQHMFSFIWLIWLIDKTLSGATTSAQSGPGSDGNKGVLRIP